MRDSLEASLGNFKGIDKHCPSMPTFVLRRASYGGRGVIFKAACALRVSIRDYGMFVFAGL